MGRVPATAIRTNFYPRALRRQWRIKICPGVNLHGGRNFQIGHGAGSDKAQESCQADGSCPYEYPHQVSFGVYFSVAMFMQATKFYQTKVFGFHDYKLARSEPGLSKGGLGYNDANS
jgi:hypothetical protein